MIAHANVSTDSGGRISIKEHTQTVPSLYQTRSGKVSALSSELRTVTARLGRFSVRLPHANAFSTLGMSDVVFGISNATFLVSSELPKTFLNGKVTACGSSSLFPNDASDISCLSEDTVTQSAQEGCFRMQLSLLNCSLTAKPSILAPQSQSIGNETIHSNLIAPTNITFMLSIEQKINSPKSLTDQNTAISVPTKICHVSVLVQELVCNAEIRSVVQALQTIHHHTVDIMEEVVSTSSPSKPSQSVYTNDENSYIKMGVVCVHLPSLELKILREHTDAHPQLLCRLTASQFEFGMEYDIRSRHHSTLHKCSVGGLSLEVCCSGDVEAERMVQILSIGGGTSSLANEAFAEAGKVALDEGVSLRAEQASTGESSTSSLSVDLSAPVVIDLNFDAIKSCSDLAYGTLMAPVYVYSKRPGGTFGPDAQQSIVSLFWSSLPSSSQTNVSASDNNDGNELYRLTLLRLFVLVPRSSAVGCTSDSFGLVFNDVELAFGQHGRIDGTKNTSLMRKNCGSIGETWQQRYSLAAKESMDPNTFYAVRSTYSILDIENSQSNHQINAVVPTQAVDWSSTTTDSFNIALLKGVIATATKAGMSFSSIGMKLYYLMPGMSTRSELSLSARQLHNMIGNYHHKVLRIIGHLNDEVETLRHSLFAKERERVGVLAACDSIVSGWVRVGEGSVASFPHRIFSAATLYRYWTVLSGKLLLVYKAPGCNHPSFILPLGPSTQLQSVAIASSNASKTGTGIVGYHLQHCGFALVDLVDGTELFFVPSNRDEYETWIAAISKALGKNRPQQQVSIGVVDDVDGIATLSLNDEILQQQLPAETAQIDETSVEKASVEVESVCLETTDETVDDEMTDEVELDTISLSDRSAKIEYIRSTNQHHDPFEDLAPLPSCKDEGAATFAAVHLNPQGEPSSVTNHDANNTQSLPLRDRMAKGKSKFAASKLSSALKSAKGGVLAAGEIGRDGIRALAQEGIQPREDRPRTQPSPTNNNNAMSSAFGKERSLVVGQRMSVLKQSASSKLTKLSTAVKSSLQEHQMPERQTRTSYLSDLSQHAEQSSIEVDPFGLIEYTESHDERPANKGKQQEMRKRFSNLDQSMRRLKIDEKLSHMSAAVKQAANDSQVMRQLSSASISHARGSDHGRHRVGIGDDIKSQQKPVKFDARETFFSHNELPVKVKSIKASGTSLVMDRGEFLSEIGKSLRKIEGNWTIHVETMQSSDITEKNPSASFDYDEQQQATTHTPDWKYKIICTEIGSGSEATAQSSVDRSLTEVLMLHALVSEIITSESYAAATEVSYQPGSDLFNPVFAKMSTLERVRVCSTLLRGIIDAGASASTLVKDKHCE